MHAICTALSVAFQGWIAPEIQGEAVALFGARPPILADALDQFLSPHTVWIVLGGLVLIGAAILFGSKVWGVVGDAAVERLARRRAKDEAAAAPQRLAQPIVITHEKEYVTLPQFREKLSEIEKEQRAIRSTVDGVLVDPKGYLHKSIHDVRNGLQAVMDASGEMEHRLTTKLDSHWHELSKERSASAARLHDRVEATNQQVRVEVDAKHAELRKEIADMPGRIVGLLRDTGAIGGKGGRA